MASSTPRQAVPFDSPAAYQIIVQGRLDPTWSDRLEGMKISQVRQDADLPSTTLEGELSDQAGLAGVLNTLYELHLILLLVKRLEIRSPNAVIGSTPAS